MRAPLAACDYLQLLEWAPEAEGPEGRGGPPFPALPRVKGAAAELNRLISRLRESVFLLLLFLFFDRRGPQETLPPVLVKVHQDPSDSSAGAPGAPGAKGGPQGAPQGGGAPEKGLPSRYAICHHRRFVYSEEAGAFVSTHSVLPEVCLGCSS
ncbi:hypothetical protein ETH_00037420 [Eimeria tenella]|uniref:Uncharacterized protein n=1 Tax=Eimeria tenella TaxID=5802 RepID=U6L1U0_EIMTE|nr:hypothetical protein ETH_00037420 [Eimeria tenella]CDJ44372.1 hypothetical protein ETH_00037420 [Eimeria tenella]|eukprot:XP_013235121.1 hypothetical protein ETH_00037420 [Eimeria tenella]